MDSKQSILDLLTPLAQGNNLLIRTAAALVIGPEPAALPSPPDPAAITTSEPSTLPAQDDPKDDTLIEAIMAALERVEGKGMTSRELAGKVQEHVPGADSVPAHQRYKFRNTLTKLVKDKRLCRLANKDPKKIRYCTAAFAAETP